MWSTPAIGWPWPPRTSVSPMSACVTHPRRWSAPSTAVRTSRSIAGCDSCYCRASEASLVEAIVSVTRGEVESWVDVHDVRPPLQMEESIGVRLAALWEHPDWECCTRCPRHCGQDAGADRLRWPAGTFGLPHEANRRITRRIASPTCATTKRTMATPVRFRGPAGLRGHGTRRRSSKSSTRASLPCHHSSAVTTPKTTDRCALTSSRFRGSPSPKVRASRSRATKCGGRSGPCASAWIRLRA